MKILIIGDVVGSRSVEYLESKLRRLRDTMKLDLVIANGENASEIHGISADAARDILRAGVDVITLGNHAFGKKDILSFLSDEENVIRPANYPPTCPGGGYTIYDVNGYRVLVINVMGTALLEPLACPFETVDRILSREEGNFDLSILDVHAEATSEKKALGYYFDGRINVIFGTHTHVPTADEQIFPRGTAYITDVGMTGPKISVIGTDKDAVIERFRTHLPVRFTVAGGEIEANALFVDIDESSGKVKEINRVNF